MVPGKTTRVRRVVVENPVQQDVTLHTETVIPERRKPITKSGDDVLTEVTVEMSDFNEVPVVPNPCILSKRCCCERKSQLAPRPSMTP
jgi:hypothetical protein